MPRKSDPHNPDVTPPGGTTHEGIGGAARPTVRMGSSSAYQLAAQVFALGVNFIVSVLVARTLGPAGKGQLSILQQIPGILAVILSGGVAYSNLYFVGTRKQSPGLALGNSIAFAGAAGLLGAPVVWLMTLGPWAILDDVAPAVVLLAIALLPVMLMASFAIAISNGLGLLKKSSLANIIATISTLLLVAISLVVDRLSVLSVLGISVITGVVSIALVIQGLRPHLGKVTIRLNAFRESAAYSLKSYFGTLAGYINYRADILMLGYLQDAKAVGIYSIAVTFAELMWYVPNALSTSVLAKSMAIDASDAAAVAARTARITSMLMIGASLFAAALIAPIIRIFYGSAFEPAVIPFIALIPGVWCMGVAKILSGYLGGQGKVYPGISAAAAGLNIAMNLALIPQMGAVGAALASTASYVMLGVGMGLAHKRHTGTPIRSLLIPTPDDVRALISAILGYWRGLRNR